MLSRFKDFFLAKIQLRLAEVTKVKDTFVKSLQALSDWSFLHWFLKDDFIQNNSRLKQSFLIKAQVMLNQMIQIMEQEKFIAGKDDLNQALIDMLPNFQAHVEDCSKR